MSQPQPIAIIGAGLSGLALSLALHQQGIKSIVYESRAEPLNIGGAVMLSPNSLRILDTLGLYTHIQKQGYNFEDLEFRTVSGSLIDTYPFGSASKYGYKANRIYRHELISLMLAAIRDANISVHYGKKFSHIVADTPTSVTFQFIDNSTSTAPLLIGADGIHSTVRKHLYPSSSHTPKFIGSAGITASISASNLPLTLRATEPITIMTRSQGAFVLAPQKPDASEFLIGKQRRIPGDPSREEWDAIHADKASHIAFLQQDNDVFGPTAVAATSEIQPTNVNVWPFFMVPKLESWVSVIASNDGSDSENKSGSIVLVGDAAHAIPPSAGQGISQAVEDVYMLALLLAKSKSEGELETVKVKGEALKFWQEFRQQRINGVLGVNAKVDKRRLPREEGDAEIEREEWDLEWLYSVDIPAEVEKWAQRRV